MEFHPLAGGAWYGLTTVSPRRAPSTSRSAFSGSAPGDPTSAPSTVTRFLDGDPGWGPLLT